MVNRRVLIVLEEGAKAQFLFCDHAADDRNFLATQVIEAYVGANANLELNCLEETHAKNVRVSNVYIERQRDSRKATMSLHCITELLAICSTLFQRERGSECFCNGCVIADKSQHVDNNTLIDHQVPHCTSNGTLQVCTDDNAVGAFAGRELVRKGARKTLSQEYNPVTCASKTARMFTSQCLRIYADDVGVIMVQQLDSSMMPHSLLHAAAWY